LSYRTKSGRDEIRFNHLPEELIHFIEEKDDKGEPLRSIRSLRVTIGPYNESFFATDGRSWRWMNLPEGLLEALQARAKDGKWTDRPRLVALGADGDFLLITEKHTAIWDLSHYRTLAKMLENSKTQEKGIEEIQHVELHAYRFQCFVALSRNGTLLYENIPQHSLADLQSLQPVIKKDAAEANRGRRANQRMDSFFNDEEWQRLGRRPSVRQNEGLKQNTSLQQRATLKREWSNRRREFEERAQGYKLKLSLSLNINPSGMAAGFSKILG
jgi:hypothetical protein